MSYNLGYLVGGLCGALVGIIVVVIFMRWARKDHSRKSKFDERQELVRGRGYKWGFYTMMAAGFVYGIVDQITNEDFITPIAATFIIVILGVMVNSGYCIWNEGYFALNDNRNRVMIGFALIGLLNFVIFGMSVFHEGIMKNGMLQENVINFVCGIMFVFIFLILLAKSIQDRREEE